MVTPFCREHFHMAVSTFIVHRETLIALSFAGKIGIPAVSASRLYASNTVAAAVRPE
jgi:hypothetical protein